jgi:signal transduction histidine kinase
VVLIFLIGIVGWGLLWSYAPAQLFAEAQERAEQQANGVAAWLTHYDNYGPDQGGELVLDAIVGVVGSDLIQIVGPDGQVLVASANAQGLPALDAHPGERLTLPNGSGFAVFSMTIHSTGPLNGAWVVAGHALTDVDATCDLIIRIYWFGLPILLLVVGVLTWALVGLAISPVRAMSREAAAISSATRHTRIGDPGGRDEIAELAATLNSMLARLERSQSTQRRFVADAAHELRSPLSGIRQYAEVALAHGTATSVEEIAETTLRGIIRIQRLVDDLLVLSRADEHNLAELLRDWVVIDLDDIVADEALRAQVEVLPRRQKPVTIDTTAVGAARITGNPDLVRLVMRNLIDNAKRHANSVVAITVAESGQLAITEVEDDGAGIAPEDRRRVFERFVRLDEARSRDTGGSGLGLSLVKEIVQTHGGTIEILDSPRGGARLRVAWPRSD